MSKLCSCEVVEHDLPLDEYHRAGLEITNGNPEVYKSLYSCGDNVTLVYRHADPITAPRPAESVIQA
jgi:hypothetical protein